METDRNTQIDGQSERERERGGRERERFFFFFFFFSSFLRTFFLSFVLLNVLRCQRA